MPIFKMNREFFHVTLGGDQEPFGRGDRLIGHRLDDLGHVLD